MGRRLAMAKNKDNKPKSKAKTKNSQSMTNIEAAEELAPKKKSK